MRLNRHKGIGSKMVDKLIKRYGNANYFWYVIRNNTPAMEFWKKMYKDKFKSTLAYPTTPNEKNILEDCIKYVGVPKNA